LGEEIDKEVVRIIQGIYHGLQHPYKGITCSNKFYPYFYTVDDYGVINMEIKPNEFVYIT